MQMTQHLLRKNDTHIKKWGCEYILKGESNEGRPTKTPRDPSSCKKPEKFYAIYIISIINIIIIIIITTGDWERFGLTSICSNFITFGLSTE